MERTVLVTKPEYRKGRHVFESAGELDVRSAPAEEKVLAEEVRQAGCRAVALGTRAYRDQLYRALAANGKGQGALIVRFGVGHEGIDKELAERSGIQVANTPGALDQSVAEHAVALMLTLARRTAGLDAEMRSRNFRGWEGMEVAGKRLIVVGFGAIGRRVARIAHCGLGMVVEAVDKLTRKELEGREKDSVGEIKSVYGVESYTRDSDRALSGADVVTVHLPACPATEDFFDAARLAEMKSGGLLVNTARGAVIDENALYDALAGGHLGGAALDVFKQEPYRPADPDKDLRELENTVLTPHVASNTDAANRRMAEAVLDNVRAFFAGHIEELHRV